MACVKKLHFSNPRMYRLFQRHVISLTIYQSNEVPKKTTNCPTSVTSLPFGGIRPTSGSTRLPFSRAQHRALRQRLTSSEWIDPQVPRNKVVHSVHCFIQLFKKFPSFLDRGIPTVSIYSQLCSWEIQGNTLKSTFKTGLPCKLSAVKAIIGHFGMGQNYFTLGRFNHEHDHRLYGLTHLSLGLQTKQLHSELAIYTPWFCFFYKHTG